MSSKPVRQRQNESITPSEELAKRGMLLGEAIKKRRKELKLTADALAKMAGVDRTFISKIERHGWFPSRLVLRKIEHALKINLFSIYIKEKNPDLEKRLPHHFIRLPLTARREFKSTNSERLANFVYRQIEKSDASMLKDNFIQLLQKLAPEKTKDGNLHILYQEVLSIMQEMQKDRNAYWDKFIRNTKQIESLVLDCKTPK